MLYVYYNHLMFNCFAACYQHIIIEIYKLENLDVAPTFKQAIERKHIPRLKTNTLITEAQRVFIEKELKYPAPG